MDSRLLTDHLYQGKYEESLADSIHTCDICGYGIFDGDDYYDINDNLFCEECIDGYKKIAE